MRLRRNDRPSLIRRLVQVFGPAILVTCGGAAAPRGDSVQIQIDPSHIVGRVDERFISYAVDTAQVTGAPFWSPAGETSITRRYPKFDFSNRVLRNLARELAPSVLRVGGTDADRTYFCDTEAVCAPPKGYDGVITRADLRAIHAFASEVGADILFTLNFGPGGRNALGERKADDDPRIISFAESLGKPPQWIWESGNEVNGYPVTFLGAFPFSVETYRDDLRRFREATNALTPQPFLAGPATLFWSSAEPLPFLDAVAPLIHPYVDVLTWHIYPTQSRRCPFQTEPSSPERLLSRDTRDNAVRVMRYVADRAGGKPVWLGEFASALCGGREGVSDTMADALWLADFYGLLAENGTSLAVRQTLAGGDYGLVDWQTLKSRPSYAVAWAYTKLFGTIYYSIYPSGEGVHVHAAAARDGSGVTAVMVNTEGAARELELALTGLDIRRAEAWTIRGVNGRLDDTLAMVNGRGPTSEGMFPFFGGWRVRVRNGRVNISMQPYSVVVARLE